MAERKYKPVAPFGTCAGCGKRFAQMLKRGCARLYCGDACKPGRQPVSKCCDIEGCDLIARSNTAQFCEKHYMRMRRNGTLLSLVDTAHYERCVYCDKRTDGRKYCSSRCSTRALRNNPMHRDCLTCGKPFAPTNKGIDKRHCSDECLRIRKQDRWDVRRGLSSSTHQGRSIRKAVFERDGWQCRICGTPTNRLAKWPQHDYPTLDHVIPVSKGGGHTMDNLQCAHARCNIRKHAKLVA